MNNGTRKYDEIVKSGAYEKSDYRPTIKSKLSWTWKRHLDLFSLLK